MVEPTGKENEWKRTTTTKCMQKSNNKKCDETKENQDYSNKYCTKKNCVQDIRMGVQKIAISPVSCNENVGT